MMTQSGERLIAYLANRSDRLREVLYQERNVVAPPPALEGMAWGIGFYQGDEVLHKKRPLEAGEVADWHRVGDDVRSDCALLHLHQPIPHAFRTSDVGPFRFRRWSYAQIGGGSADALPVDELPDFLRRAVRGSDTAERFLHRILSHVHNAGGLDHGDPPAKTVIAAIRATAAEAARDSAVGEWAGVLTNGHRTYVIQCGTPIYRILRKGVLDSLDAGTTDSRAGGSGELRYLLAVAGLDSPPDPPYEPLSPDSVLVAQRDLEMSTHEL